MSILNSIEDVLEGTFSPVRRHRVEFPENLTTISKRYYGCGDYAMAIYQANRSVLTDPDSVTPGLTLVIPHIPHPKRHGKI
jgi:nucleoid-associated protein YgaU